VEMLRMVRVVTKSIAGLWVYVWHTQQSRVCKVKDL
jgi:hypothetical protein